MTISASDYQYEDTAMQAIKEHCKHFKVKSKTLSTGQLNLVLEFAGDDEKDRTDALLGIDMVYIPLINERNDAI